MPLAATGAAAGVRIAGSAMDVADGCTIGEPGSAFADVGLATSDVSADVCEAEPGAVRATSTDGGAPAGIDEAGAEPAAPADDGAVAGCATGAAGPAIVLVAACASPIGDDPARDADVIDGGNELGAVAAVPTGAIVAATDAADTGTCAAGTVEDVAAATDERVAAMDAAFAADAGVTEPDADVIEPTEETVAATGALLAADIGRVEPDAASAGVAAANG